MATFAREEIRSVRAVIVDRKLNGVLFRDIDVIVQLLPCVPTLHLLSQLDEMLDDGINDH